ncbi:MAG: alkaline phosphatase family protein [Muribaculaceae bacterium]|nr:alkaline phosphatase family protein [Muribaculaceae bacterium]
MNRLLTTFVVGLAGIQGITLAAESRPKLVVGIMVDQLRTDYLESLRDMFGNGGFRRLMHDGIYLKDVDFVVPGGDASSASAIVQTGSYPRMNGISGAMIYDPSSKMLKPIFTDDAYLGNFTTETYSPGALRVTTITDELSVEEGGKSKIHSIAPDAAQAIVLAGHTGQSAFWVNEETGRWSTSTYYTDPPASLKDRNYTHPLISRLDTMIWTPLKMGEPYPYVSKKEISDGFRYTFSRSDRDAFSLYKLSPFVNDDITEIATEYISDLKLGKNDEGTDVLNIGYTLAPYPLAGNEDYKYELEDAYLRLDKDLEILFNSLDRHVGKDNVLVYLVSTGYFEEPIVDNQVYRLPGGTFSVKRAMSLLNAFLSAKYGNGAYVDQYAKNQIYLSEKTLEEKNLHPEKIAEEARDFLVKMSGVADAYTMADLMSPAIPQLETHRLAIDHKTSGDVLLEFSPGWKVVDDSRYPSKTEPKQTTAFQAPGFIMGPGINARVENNPVPATAIAPTVAGKLRIRSPNSANTKPIVL